MLSTNPSLNIINYELEDISDDENLPIPQLSSMNNNILQQVSHELLTFEPILTSQAKLSQVNLHSRRSNEVQIRRNKKRNIHRHLCRYRNYIVQEFYYQFTLICARHILCQFHINVVHIKYKNQELNHQYSTMLSVDIFSRQHYYRL
ncbi:unnamed protein product [Adineta steineri]|uniref:Uncharacterized protein n=1 Tax=Adineta steineri TaxID=433720 RepID=A0A814JJ71_9BILA|nr:unnamed protein product [Adineta steineri]CAF1148199.1 unnamed protein product [Adineta steineri]CAF3698124.1 unnamed protein product [Adineta steineri]CAF3724483.1 unnamed protein product [Adineta steineri]